MAAGAGGGRRCWRRRRLDPPIRRHHPHASAVWAHSTPSTGAGRPGPRPLRHLQSIGDSNSLLAIDGDEILYGAGQRWRWEALRLDKMGLQKGVISAASPMTYHYLRRFADDFLFVSPGDGSIYRVVSGTQQVDPSRSPRCPLIPCSGEWSGSTRHHRRDEGPARRPASAAGGRSTRPMRITGSARSRRSHRRRCAQCRSRRP